MKKIISFILAFMMLGTTVFAKSADDIVKLYENAATVTSAKVSGEFYTTVNRPLKILDTIPENEDIDINYSMLAESIINSKATFDCSYNMSSDYKKADIGLTMAFDTPIAFNDGFSLAAYTKMSIWYTYDFTDLENPIFKMIYDIPFMKKYMVIDLSAAYAQTPELKNVFNQEYIKDLNKKAIEALIKNAKISKNGNIYTISLTDEAAKQYIIDVLLLGSETSPDENAEIFNNMVSILNETFADFSFLGDKGITIKLKASGKKITAEETSIHICFNVFDILEANALNTDGLTREDAFIDLTMTTKTTTGGHGKTKVSLPEITEDNAEVLPVGSSNSSYYKTVDKSPVIENGTIYYPLYDIAQMSEIDVTEADGKITITDTLTGTTVTTSLENSEFSLNDTADALPYPAVIKSGDSLYATSEILNYVHILSIEANYDLDEKKFNFSFYYEEPSEEEIILPEDITLDYTPPHLYYNYHYNKPAYIGNNCVYTPIYPFLLNWFDGEFTFAAHELTYTATGENVFGINTFHAKTGDSFITINGEQVMLDAPIYEDEVDMQIPLSFLEGMGFEVNAHTYYYTDGTADTTFNLTMENPEYQDDFYDDYEYIPETLYYSVITDNLPYVKNDELYIPAYDLLNEVFIGEYEKTENGFTFTVTEENAQGVEKISVLSDDKFISVDDQKLELVSPAATVNDAVYIPVGFAEQLGLTITDISANSYTTIYNFKMPNPDYVENNASSFESTGNWFLNIFGY